VAVALAAVLLIAAPSYALVTHVIDFSDKAPAPSVVRKRFHMLFSSGAPPGMDPRVIADQTRLVTVFKLPSGDFPLWVAPTKTNGLCEEIVDLWGGCIADRNFPGIESIEHEGFKPWLLDVTYGGVRDVKRGIDNAYVSGVVLPKEASRLELRLDDGTVRAVTFVWVSPPIDAGFFLIELPRDRTGVYPAVLSLFDAEGHLLSQSEPLQPPHRPRSLSHPPTRTGR
jgi:hypothetical protein